MQFQYWYDEYLPDVLMQKGFAYGVLDIDEMKSKMFCLCDEALNQKEILK